MSTTFTYTANSTGWAQFYAFPRPGDATTRVGLQGVDCQSVVQDRHGDGSIKMALCTAKITATGNYNLTYDQAAPPGSTYQPSWPIVIVTFSDGGVQYTATAPAFSVGTATDIWHTGPLAFEAAYLVAPINSSNAQHPLVQVWFDMCGFNDGAVLVSVTVQNVREAASRQINLDSFQITISSSVQSIQSLTQLVAPSNRQLWFAQTFTWVGSVGGYNECIFEPPSEMLYQAGLFPRILASAQNKTDYVHTGSVWEPGGFGDMSDVQEAPGGRYELGPVTNPVAEWLVHHHVNQRQHIVAMGICAGSWHGNFLRADGKTQVQITASSESFGYSGGGGINSRWILQPSHLPQLHLGPLIITTRKHFLRGMQGWACAMPSYMYYGPATCNPYRMSDVDYDFGIHAGGQICNFECIGAGEPRDYWGLRAIEDAAAMTPTGDPVKAYCQQISQENVTHCDIYGGRGPAHNAGPFYPPEFEFDPGIQGGYGGVHTNYASTSYWQAMYKCYALWRAALLGYTTNYGYIRRTSQSFLDYLTAAPTNQWQYVFGFYYVRVAVHPQQSTHSMLATWAAVFDANWVNHGQLDGNDNGGNAGLPYYNLEYRMLLMWCKFLSITGYETGLTYVEQTRGALAEAQSRTNMAFDDLVNPGNVVLPDNNTVVANPTSIPADGVTTSTITVTLKDGSNVPLVGKTVTLAAGSGSSTITTVSGTTNGSGVATFTVKDASAQTVTYTATNATDSVTIVQQASVTFTVVSGGGGMLSFSGTVSAGSNTDPNSSNNSIAFTVTPQASPTTISDLSISYKLSTTSPVTALPFTVTWTVWNAGPNDTTNATATISVPGGLTLQSHTESIGSYNSSTGSWSGLAIPVGGVAVMRWVVVA